MQVTKDIRLVGSPVTCSVGIFLKFEILKLLEMHLNCQFYHRTSCTVFVLAGANLYSCDRILRGERPYWWIHENPKWQNSDVKQFELTCETGPGL